MRDSLVTFLAEKSKLAVGEATTRQHKALEKERAKHWNHVSAEDQERQSSSNAAALETECVELGELKGFAEASLKLHTPRRKASPQRESIDESF